MPSPHTSNLAWSTITKTSILFCLLFLSFHSIASSKESPVTVKDVAKDLACPCQCPLILQDCNMSCGLKWKDEVGQLIAKGKTKQEISKYFIAKYGEAARLTPLQKIYGKIFQYTRGFGTSEWILLWSGVAIWTIFMFLIVYIVVSKLSARYKTT